MTNPDAAIQRALVCPVCKQQTTERTSTNNGFCRRCSYIFARNAPVTLTQEELLALLTARETALNEWKEAIIDACVVDWVLEKEHYTNPRKAVSDLLAWQVKLDPAVSKEAHGLYERAEQAEAKVTALEADLATAQQERDEQARMLAESRATLTTEIETLMDEKDALRDQVARQYVKVDSDNYAALVSHLRALITTWWSQAQASTNPGAARAWQKSAQEVEALLPPGVSHQEKKS